MDKDKAGISVGKIGLVLIGLTAILAVPIFAFVLFAIKASSTTPTPSVYPASVPTVQAATALAQPTLPATPTQAIVIMPSATQPVAVAPSPGNIRPTPATSQKLLGRSLGRVSLLMNEQELLQRLGEPKVRTALHGNGSPEWDYDGLLVGGLPVWLLHATSPFKVTTTEGFSLGQDKATFKRIYESFTINGYQTEEEDQFIVMDGTITLNVGFDRTGKASFIDLRCEWSNTTNKFC